MMDEFDRLESQILERLRQECSHMLKRVYAEVKESYDLQHGLNLLEDLFRNSYLALFIEQS